MQIRATRRADAALAPSGRRAAVRGHRAAVATGAAVRAAARERARAAIVAIAASPETRDVVARARSANTVLTARALEAAVAALADAGGRAIVSADRIADHAHFAVDTAGLCRARGEAEAILTTGCALRAVGVQIGHHHVHFNVVELLEGERALTVRDFFALPEAAHVDLRELAGEGVAHVEFLRLRRCERHATFSKGPCDWPKDRIGPDCSAEAQLID